MSEQKKQDEIKATVEQLRKFNTRVQQPDTAYVAGKKKTLPKKMRVSSITKKVETQDRKAVMNTLVRQILLGEITQGEALKQFRIHVLGLKQDAYAKLVSVSRKTLSDVENDKGNYSIEIVNRIYKPFGLQVGLVPIAKNLFTTLLS